MAFSRALAPRAAPESDALTSAMVGIGMGVAGPGAVESNIEDTLFSRPSRRWKETTSGCSRCS
jgi:hypothetical protein